MYARIGMNRPLSRSTRAGMYQSSEAAQSQEALGHEAEEQEHCSSPNVLSSFLGSLPAGCGKISKNAGGGYYIDFL